MKWNIWQCWLIIINGVVACVMMIGYAFSDKTSHGIWAILNLQLFLGLWDSIPTFLNTGYPMSGHLFVEQEEHKNCTVTITKCEVCGETDICWSRSTPITNEDNLK